ARYCHDLHSFPTRRSSDLSGYYSLSGGISASKVMDPVVLFGSVSYSYNFSEENLNQRRGGTILDEVHPGHSLSFSMGFAYSLSRSEEHTSELQSRENLVCR